MGLTCIFNLRHSNTASIYLIDTRETGKHLNGLKKTKKKQGKFGFYHCPKNRATIFKIWQTGGNTGQKVVPNIIHVVCQTILLFVWQNDGF